MSREPQPDPVMGWADMVGFVPSDELREDEPPKRKRAPRKRKAPEPSGWVIAPQFQPYGDYDGLLVRTVLLRSDKYRSIHDLPFIESANDIAKLCGHVGFYDQEHMVVLSLGARNQCTAIFELAIGPTSAAPVELKHAMKIPLLTGASAMVLVHNHPSGNKMPSSADKELTERLLVGLACVGVVLLDHVIVSHGDYYSFLEHGLLKHR